MSKTWIITGASLMIIGLIIFAAVMTVNGWNFTKLSTVRSVTNTYPLTEPFSGISVHTSTANIILQPADHGEVVCQGPSYTKYTVTVQNGILTVEEKDERRWFEYIGIFAAAPKITLWVPQELYTTLSIRSGTGNIEIPKELRFGQIDIAVSTGNVTNYASATDLIRIRTSTGDIRVENVATGLLDISVSTGKTDMTNIRCQSLTSTGSTGHVVLKDVIATGSCSIQRTTGKVLFDRCDAAELLVTTDTGDVTGSLLTEKVFTAQTDTGRVQIPQTTTGGPCQIRTSTGDIKIAIAP